MKKAYYNCLLFDGLCLSRGKAVIVFDSLIESVVGEKTILNSNEYELIDLNGMLLAPGFVDLQINGGGGVLFADNPSLDSLKEISKAHLQYGVMYFLPTLISADLQSIKKATSAVKLALYEDIGVLGLHLEGPFISLEKRGIHNQSNIRNASLNEIDTIFEEPGIIKIMTVAPEACDLNCLKSIISKGCKAFLGHSNATSKITEMYFDNGAIGVSHLYNAMSQMTAREIGMVGASLSSQTYASIICDGYHVDYEAIKIAKENKKEKLFFVSDAMPPVGVGDMDFKIGDKRIICHNQRCLSDDGVISGSSLNMNLALKNGIRFVGLDLLEALKMTSTYQAMMLGTENHFGFIKKGNFANMVVLNEQFGVAKIIKNGNIQTVETHRDANR